MQNFASTVGSLRVRGYGNRPGGCAMSSDESSDDGTPGVEALAAVLQRRRVVVAAVIGMDLLAPAKDGRGPQGSKRLKAPFVWQDHVEGMTHRDFRARYRLNWEAFYDLCDALYADMDYKDETSRQRSMATNCGAEFPVEARVAVGLRMLAGASYLDLKLIYNISTSFCYDCLWLLVDAVNKNLLMEFPLSDVAKMEVLEKEFAHHTPGGAWRGQVAAIDGVHFAMQKPCLKECDNAARWTVYLISAYYS